MKHLHLFITSVTLGTSLAMTASALEVTTEPTYRDALIEEFTGIQCGNCPDGHRIASELLHAHPGQVYTVAIHAGYFADPRTGEPNFKTAAGTEIHDYFDVSSYPCATVNREDFGKGTVCGRSDWGMGCAMATRELSPVNLAVSTSYDPSTRCVEITVEGYFTADMEQPRLSLFMLQDNIYGPQSGGLLGDEYPHRHMLRANILDDAFGEVVAEHTAGSHFTRTVNYTLPQAIDDIAVIDTDVEMLAFVTEGKESVMKCAASHLKVPGAETNGLVTASAPLLTIGGTYALNYLEFFIDNYTGAPVTEATFDVMLNGTTTSVSWEGNAPAHEFTPVKIDISGLIADTYINDTNNLSVKLTSANGKPAESTSVKSTFKDLPEWPTSLTVKIKTDNFAADNTYRIIDTDGNTVKEFGPYTDGQVTEASEIVELENGRIYGLEVTDAWGNGVYTPRGNVKVYNSDTDKLVGQLNEIKDYGVRTFFRTADTSSTPVINPTDVTAISKTYHTLNGVAVSEPPTGLSIETTRFSDGHTESKLINNTNR